jgi:hypothetical protein
MGMDEGELGTSEPDNLVFEGTVYDPVLVCGERMLREGDGAYSSSSDWVGLFEGSKVRITVERIE